MPNGVTLTYNLVDAPMVGSSSRWSSLLVTAAEGSLEMRNVTIKPEQVRPMLASTSRVFFLMPTLNPCQNRSEFGTMAYYDEFKPMPPTKVSSCAQLNLPGVKTLPGFFSVTAAMCFFYPSLQNYRGSIVNGSFKEETVGDPILLESPVLINETLAIGNFSEPCLLNNAVHSNSSSDTSSVPGRLITMTDTRRNTTGPLRCVYGFNRNWFSSFSRAESLLSSIIVGGTELESVYCANGGNYTSMICSGAWWLNDLFNGGNASVESINGVMNRAYKSLTNQLRTIGTDWEGNSSTAPGTVLVMEVCTQFRWAWLIYPLVVVLGTLILLLGAMMSRRDVTWKSSILPLLFYGLEREYQSGHAELSSVGELDGAAKVLRAGFNLNDDGWRFHTRDGQGGKD